MQKVFLISTSFLSYHIAHNTIHVTYRISNCFGSWSIFDIQLKSIKRHPIYHLLIVCTVLNIIAGGQAFFSKTDLKRYPVAIWAQDEVVAQVCICCTLNICSMLHTALRAPGRALLNRASGFECFSREFCSRNVLKGDGISHDIKYEGLCTSFYWLWYLFHTKNTQIYIHKIFKYIQ